MKTRRSSRRAMARSGGSRQAVTRLGASGRPAPPRGRRRGPRRGGACSGRSVPHRRSPRTTASRSPRPRPTRSFPSEGLVHVSVDGHGDEQQSPTSSADPERHSHDALLLSSRRRSRSTPRRPTSGRRRATRAPDHQDHRRTTASPSSRSTSRATSSTSRSTGVPRRLRPAWRCAPVRQRHPGRVGVRDVLRMGVRRPRRRQHRHSGRIRGRDQRLDGRRDCQGRRHDARPRPASRTRTSGTPSSSPTAATR